MSARSVLVCVAIAISLVLWVILASNEKRVATKSETARADPRSAEPRNTTRPEKTATGGAPSARAPDATGNTQASRPMERAIANSATRGAAIDTQAPLSWASSPSLGEASGPAQAAAYSAEFELVHESCGNRSPTATRDFETAIVDGGLVIQFNNASWLCELTGEGAFECPTVEEAQNESDGKRPHLERAARGVWHSDGSMELRAQTRTWCEGPDCDTEPCMWSFQGEARAR